MHEALFDGLYERGETGAYAQSVGQHRWGDHLVLGHLGEELLVRTLQCNQ